MFMHYLISSLPWYDETFTIMIIVQMGTLGLESWNHTLTFLSWGFAYCKLFWIIHGTGEGVGLNKYEVVNENSIKIVFIW